MESFLLGHQRLIEILLPKFVDVLIVRGKLSLAGNNRLLKFREESLLVDRFSGV